MPPRSEVIVGAAGAIAGADTRREVRAAVVVDASGQAAMLMNRNGLRVAALGKSGSVTAQLKSLGAMSPDQRAAEGPKVHALREAVTEAIAARKAVLDDAALEQRLATERLDLTLPVAGPPVGELQHDAEHDQREQVGGSRSDCDQRLSRDGHRVQGDQHPERNPHVDTAQVVGRRSSHPDRVGTAWPLARFRAWRARRTGHGGAIRL